MGNNVPTNLNREREITRRQFQAALNQATSDVEMQKQAMSIFNTYAKKTAGGDDDVLDVNEQREAQEAFSALDADGKDEVSENEFNAQKNDNPDLKDTSYQVYSAFTQALGSIKPKEKSSVEVAKEKFSNDKDIKKAVASYLLGAELGDDVSDSMVNFSEGAYEIIMPEKDSTEPIKVKYGDKEFIVHIIDDKVSIDSTDGETTLQQAVLASNSTDVRHNYYNKDGIAGNSASVYKADTGKISNDSPRRQQVNPAQTFASMILNDNTNSTLKFKEELKAKDVIAVITEDSNSKEITLPQLVKYLKAVANEAKETVDNGITTGSRTAAEDVDFDIKDMANIGVVFKKYAGPDGKLNEVELQNLINDLSKGKKSMTELARNDKDNKYQYQAPTKPDDTLPEADPVTTTPQPQKGTKLQANRQRYIAGSGKKETVNYEYKDGMRTVVDKDGYRVTDYNIAEYEDHGLLGSGKKDFVKIQGLPPAVRAEVFDGELQHNMIIKVKDSRGNEKYYRVNYDATKGTYTMGDEISEATAKSIKNPPKPEKPKKRVTNPQGDGNQKVYANPIENPAIVKFSHRISGDGAPYVTSDVGRDGNGAAISLTSRLSEAATGLFDSSSLSSYLSSPVSDILGIEILSSEIKDNNGNTIIKCENDKYYDGNENLLSRQQVRGILDDISKNIKGKYKDAKFVQHIKQKTQPGTLAPQNDEVNKGHVHDFAFRLEEDFGGQVEISLNTDTGDYIAKIGTTIAYPFVISNQNEYNDRKAEIQSLLDALDDKDMDSGKFDFDTISHLDGVSALTPDSDNKNFTITLDNGETTTVDNNADGFKRALNFIQYDSVIEGTTGYKCSNYQKTTFRELNAKGYLSGFAQQREDSDSSIAELKINGLKFLITVGADDEISLTFKTGEPKDFSNVADLIKFIQEHPAEFTKENSLSLFD